MVECDEGRQGRSNVLQDLRCPLMSLLLAPAGVGPCQLLPTEFSGQLRSRRPLQARHPTSGSTQLIKSPPWQPHLKGASVWEWETARDRRF
jgi:hypothetical protein